MLAGDVAGAGFGAVESGHACASAVRAMPNASSAAIMSPTRNPIRGRLCHRPSGKWTSPAPQSGTATPAARLSNRVGVLGWTRRSEAEGVDAGLARAAVAGPAAHGGRLAGRHAEAAVADGGAAITRAAVVVARARRPAGAVDAHLARHLAVAVGHAARVGRVIGPAEPAFTAILGAAVGVAAAGRVAGRVDAGAGAALGVEDALPAAHGVRLAEAAEAGVAGAAVAVARARRLAPPVAAACARAALAGVATERWRDLDLRADAVRAAHPRRAVGRSRAGRAAAARAAGPGRPRGARDAARGARAAAGSGVAAPGGAG